MFDQEPETGLSRIVSTVWVGSLNLQTYIWIDAHLGIGLHLQDLKKENISKCQKKNKNW